MAITLKDVGEYLWPHYAPLWRERFKRWGFDADKWDDATLKAAIHCYVEVVEECDEPVPELRPIRSRGRRGR